MKTALQIHFFGSVWKSSGSVEKIILTIANHMQRYRPAIASVSSRTSEYSRDGVRFYDFKENRIKNRILNKILNLDAFTFDTLIEGIERLRPSILHFHNRHKLIDTVVKKLSYRPKVIAQYHRRFEELVIPDNCDMLIAVSRTIEAHVREKSGTEIPVEILYNPIPDAVLKMVPMHNADNPVPVLLYGSGGVIEKGFFDLLDAAAHLADLDYLLQVCGGSLNRYLPTLRQIENLGLLTGEQYLAVLETADIVVVPSWCEPFGLVALEAMYLGKIVVATDRCGLREFTDSSCVIQTPPRDPDRLAQALRTAIALARQRDTTCRDLRHNAHERSLLYHPTSITQRLELLYDKLMPVGDF